MTVHRLTRLSAVAALALAGVMSGLPGYGAEEDRNTASQQPPQQPREREEKSSDGGRLKELERCKEEARGMRGPERGTFMTECLGGEQRK